MSGKCELCGKMLRFGHHVSHSKRHTARCWVPNIRRATVTVEGRMRRLNVCMRCLRTQNKLG